MCFLSGSGEGNGRRMSTLHTRFEIFVSYAHKDNAPVPAQTTGWITALRDQILADHRRFSTEPLLIFFDTDDIRDMDDWEHRILGALRYSRILLVCLSPSYFASPYCRREWEEYVARQPIGRRTDNRPAPGWHGTSAPSSGAAACRLCALTTRT